MEIAIPRSARDSNLLTLVAPGHQIGPDKRAQVAIQHAVHSVPLFEAAKTNFRAHEAEKAKFRMPYFAVQFTRIEPR